MRSTRTTERFLPQASRRALLVLTGAFVLALALAPAASAETKQLEKAVRAALAPTQGIGQGTKAAVEIVDVLTGQTLLSNPYASQAFGPASNMKLLTSAVALDRFGPDTELPTTLAISGDDLVVIGSGDPGLGDASIAQQGGLTSMSVFDEWAQALRNAGVVRIAGDLVVVDTVFDDQLIHPTWGNANARQWYGAPVAGVNYNDNCVDFTFLPGKVGRPATVQTLPPAGGFVVKGKVTTTGDKKKHNPILDKQLKPVDGKSVFTVGGLVVNKAGPYSKPVDDPAKFFGEALKAALAERGVAVLGSVRVLRTGGEDGGLKTRWIATHQTPITAVLGRVNTNSQNMMAEALAKLNGLAFQLDLGTPREQARGSWATAHDAAIAFLKRLGIDTLAVTSADGSGLSRENRLSATVLVDLLQHMLAEHEHGEYYLDSMAVSGVRGSVRNRMKSLKGRVYAKTGTIRGVSALSGYVFAENGRVAAFSILHNGPKLGSSAARGQQDKVVLALAKWLESQPAVVVSDPEVVEAMQHVGLKLPQ